MSKIKRLERQYITHQDMSLKLLDRVLQRFFNGSRV